MGRIKQRIIDWWDWKIYWLAYATFNRMVKRNAGFAYLFKMHVDGWLRENPLPPELERATEAFFDSFHGRIGAGNSKRLFAPPRDQEGER